MTKIYRGRIDIVVYENFSKTIDRYTKDYITNDIDFYLV